MIIGTASTYVFESFTFLQSWWDNVVEIGKFDATSRAYSRPILRSTIERCSFCKNYTNLYFNAKHLEKGLDRGGGGGGAGGGGGGWGFLENVLTRGIC